MKIFLASSAIINLMKTKKKNLLFGIIGPGASGKTEISRHVKEKHGFLYIPSLTTRPVRKGNTEEYKHVEVDVFESYIKNGKLLEYAFFVEHYYGKFKKDVEEHLERGDCLYTLTVDRVKKIKKLYNHAKIICILPEDPILETVEKRLRNRGHDEMYIKKRIKTTKEELKAIETLKNQNLIDHFIRTLETDYHHALKQIDKVVKHEHKLHIKK